MLRKHLFVSLKADAKKKFILGKSINLRDIEILDAEFVLKLRTDNEKSRFLHKTENDLTAQIEYIKRYKNKKQEWYFIIEGKDGERLGTVRIYDVIDNDDFCWGSWIIKDGASVNVAMESALLLYHFAFYVLGFSKAHFDVRKQNRSVRAFHERLFGAKITGESEDDVFYELFREDYEKVNERYGRILFNNIAIIL